MRQRFEQQTTLGIRPISEVKLPLKSRDELPAVLLGLQYVFLTSEVNEKIFSLLESKITATKKKTGRKGMDLWHILVLAVVRQALDTNWDRLELLANGDKFVRQILGVHVIDFGIEEQEFCYQTMIDNVSLIDDDMLQNINEIVALHGQTLLKKKVNEALQLKTDSFVLETNVHFPTDLNLLWDSTRKCLDIIKTLMIVSDLEGWRKVVSIKKEFKIVYRNCSQQVFKGKSEEQKTKAVKLYIDKANELSVRFEAITSNPPAFIAALGNQEKLDNLLEEFKQYHDYVKKQIDLIDRRLLKNEIIPATEKIHSVFESHTEWIKKGKANNKVELGHMILITTDQYQFIVDYKVMEHEKDAAQVKPLLKRLATRFVNTDIDSHSFDKGFYSKENFETLTQTKTQQIVLPKKGKLNKIEKEREGTKEFKTLRNKHSAVESNINMLEHHGLNRCPDKGIVGFKRYVGLSVLAYNLHILGNHLKAQAIKKELSLQKQRDRYRQAA